MDKGVTISAPEEPVIDPEIAERVKSGEYFREMKQAYGTIYLNPMPERYFYMAYTAVCIVILLVILYILLSLFPLTESIPFLYYSHDVYEEKPVIRPLRASAKEDINTAIKRMMADEYVIRRESYDIDTLEVNVRFVKAQSSANIYNGWQSELDPGNPASPIAQFQRHSLRRIGIVGTNFNTDGTIEVIYDAIVVPKTNSTGQDTPKTTRMMAMLAFQYTDVTIDQKTGAKTPLHFIVTDYHTRRLQE